MTRIIYRGSIALRNLNKITEKYSRWVNRWYYGLGSLECRECNKMIIDQRDVCLYYGKIMHVDCLNISRGKKLNRSNPSESLL